MNRTAATVATAATMFILGAVLLKSAQPQAASANTDTLTEGVFVARGEFDVQLLVDGEGDSRILNRVTEVSLLRDWAVLQRAEAGKNITLVIPRDALVSLEMID